MAETHLEDAYLIGSMVTKRFPGGKGREPVVALSNINFKVGKGEFVSLVGPSGCGKSTLLRLIAGLDFPTDGKITLGGQRVTKPSSDLGVVFQVSALLEWRNVLDNVALPLELSKDRKHSKAERYEMAGHYLELAGLADFSTHYPSQLSGGMKQRVSICRALVHNPGLLLMDEPFGALDAFTRASMGDELLRIWEATNATVIFVTHDIGESVYLSDRVIAMSPRPGRIVAALPIELARPREEGMHYFPEYVNAERMLHESIR